jgi:hypothetical protein
VLGEQFAPHWILFNKSRRDHALANKYFDHSKSLSFAEALLVHVSYLLLPLPSAGRTDRSAALKQLDEM